jgi:hypothetical protein
MVGTFELLWEVGFALCCCDANGTRYLGRALLDLDEERFLSWFQISNSNPMVGVHARIQLLRDVGKSLLSLPDIFGSQGRPGNLVGMYAVQTLAFKSQFNLDPD